MDLRESRFGRLNFGGQDAQSTVGYLTRAGAIAVIVILNLAGCSAEFGTSDRNGVSALGEPPPVGGPPLVRRLTESQYRATIADIFGPDVPIVARFGRELRADNMIAIGTSKAGISPFSLEQYDNAAAGIVDFIFAPENRARFMVCKPGADSDFDEQCARTTIEHYGSKLFRRPLREEQIARYLEQARRSTELVADYYVGLGLALRGLLSAPEFLFRIEEVDEQNPDSLSAFSKAERLSFFLTNSAPDDALLAAAESGALNTDEGLEQQVERLMSSSKFEQALRAFFADMLEFDLFEDLTKDAQLYPAFSPVVALDAQEQTLKTIVHHLVDQQGDYRDLFTLRETFLTRALGIVYQLPVPTRNGWEQTVFPEDSEYAGIQSHLSFLALHSHPGRSSPSLRGKAIREVFLCQEVPDPPANVVFNALVDTGGNTMPTARDRLHAHNSEPACAGCHKIMDPPGYALENYDGVGTWRDTENGAVIDASGNLDGRPFSSPLEFGEALRDHPETGKCVAERMYRFAVGRDIVWYEREYMDYLIEAFKAREYKVPSLMRDIAMSENFFTIDSDAVRYEGASL